MNPFELDAIDSFLSDLEAIEVASDESSVDNVSFPVADLAIVDSSSSTPNNNSEANTMISTNAANSSSNAATPSVNTTSMNTNNFLFRYTVDLTNQEPSSKGGKVTLVAKTAEGAVIKVGAYGTWMENLLPYEVDFNTDEAVRRGLIDPSQANGWQKRSFDDLVRALFYAQHGIEIHLARHVVGESGKRDQLASHLVDLIEADPEVSLLNAQIKIDLDRTNVVRDGKPVEVEEDTFEAGERDFKAIRICFDDLEFYGVNVNPNTGVECQNFSLINYQVELLTRRIGAPLGAGLAAAALGNSNVVKAAKLPAVTKGGNYLAGLQKARVIRASGIGSTALPSAPKPGSDLADQLDAPKVKSSPFVKPPTNLGGLDV